MTHQITKNPSNILMIFNVNLKKKSNLNKALKNPHQNQLSAILHHVIHCSEYLKEYHSNAACCL